eukprot:15434595-Alexandrium_andersonii.AAC.1
MGAERTWGVVWHQGRSSLRARGGDGCRSDGVAPDGWMGPPQGSAGNARHVGGRGPGGPPCGPPSRGTSHHMRGSGPGSLASPCVGGPAHQSPAARHWPSSLPPD